MALSFGALFAIVLILVSLLRTFGVPWTSDMGSYGDQQALVFQQLNLVADLKTVSLGSWLEERKIDAAALAGSQIVASRIGDLLDEANRASSLPESSGELRRILLGHTSHRTLTETLQLFTGFHEVYGKAQIADARDGVVLASTDPDEVGTQLPANLRSFGRRVSAQTASVVLTQSTEIGKPCMVISQIVQAKPATKDSAGTNSRAMVLTYVDLGQLVKLLSSNKGRIGQSEEVVLVDRERNLLTPLRHLLPHGTEAKLLEYRVEAEPARRAAQGEDGILVGPDYRGVSVLAAYRHIAVAPDTGWGLVVKLDKSELLGPSYRRLSYASWITLIGALTAGMMGALIARGISRPVQELSRAARSVESGNLSARAVVFRSDEVGILAKTFNSMIERVQNWHRDLERQVSERTLRLSHLNEELSAEVAERGRAEERVRQQRNFLQTVLESLPHPFYVVDPTDYAIKMANAAALRGQPLDGVTCHALTHGRTEPCNDADHPCPLAEASRTGEAAVAEHIHCDGDGNLKYYEVHAYPIVDGEGKIAQVIEYSLDITDRKRSEEERDRLIVELEAKNAELERFAYTASHDLKSPLITIKGFLRYVEQDMASGNVERLRSDSARIRAAVDKMARLLDDLLELSRIGRIMNPPQEVSLRTLVLTAMETLAGRLADREVSVEIAESLPMLYGDAARLREVVENLLDNAIKFMGDQPSPKIEIGAQVENEENVVFFKDNGIGIDPKYHERIFGLFNRLDQDVEGTGIGLAIARRIVEVHGGRIWVQSEGNGRGSVFSMSLPEKKRETR
jgi:signal transduction histidine kinase